MFGKISAFQLLLTVSAVAAFALTLYSGEKIKSRVEKNHPEMWQWLGGLEYKFNDGSPQDASILEFVWSGRYKGLNDETLDRTATQFKIACALTIASTITLMAIQ